jgi:bifunctional DNA-binding transcriptional regulator/antitoxin component of YhaV-PrlF toxin-antitoxin module
MVAEEFELVLDEAGRILLPAEVRERLGWQPGAVLAATIEGASLRLIRRPVAATETGRATISAGTATIKDQARRLADAMRGIADTKEVRGILSTIGLGSPEAAPPPPASEASDIDPTPVAPSAPRPAAPSLPLYRCRRAPGPVRIDGSLDEAAWSRAEPVHLTLSEDDGEPRLATEVRISWDERALYVAFSCKDTDIWGTLTERDQPIYNEEVVEVFLCPTGDLRHYFEFEVSPRNVLFDAKVFSPEGDRRSMLLDREWDAPDLQSAVRVAGTLDRRDDVDLGWIAEIAISFADLGLPHPPMPGDRWRANFYRIERGEVEEYTAWSPTLRIPADFHVPDRFGTLEFVDE